MTGPTRKIDDKHLVELQDMRDTGRINWERLSAMFDEGTTSQTQAAAILGVSQPWISRKVRHAAGTPWALMDAARTGATR